MFSAIPSVTGVEGEIPFRQGSDKTPAGHHRLSPDPVTGRGHKPAVLSLFYSAWPSNGTDCVARLSAVWKRYGVWYSRCPFCHEAGFAGYGCELRSRQ